jgi:hypothetical protein
MPPKRKMASKSKKRTSRLARTLTLGLGPVPIQLQVNGQTLSTTASTWLTLLQVLRENVGLACVSPDNGLVEPYLCSVKKRVCHREAIRRNR